MQNFLTHFFLSKVQRRISIKMIPEISIIMHVNYMDIPISDGFDNHAWNMAAFHALVSLQAVFSVAFLAPAREGKITARALNLRWGREALYLYSVQKYTYITYAPNNIHLT